MQFRCRCRVCRRTGDLLELWLERSSSSIWSGLRTFSINKGSTQKLCNNWTTVRNFYIDYTIAVRSRILQILENEKKKHSISMESHATKFKNRIVYRSIFRDFLDKQNLQHVIYTVLYRTKRFLQALQDYFVGIHVFLRFFIPITACILNIEYCIWCQWTVQ